MGETVTLTPKFEYKNGNFVWDGALRNYGPNLGYDYGGAAGAGPASNSNSESTSAAGNFDSTGFSTGQPGLQEWYFDDGVIDGEQLMRAAESLDVGAFQWYTDDGGAFEGLDASLL